MFQNDVIQNYQEKYVLRWKTNSAVIFTCMPSVLIAFSVIGSFMSASISHCFSLYALFPTRSISFSILLIITGRNHHAEKQWTSHGHAPTIDAYNYRRNRLHAILSREWCEPWKDYDTVRIKLNASSKMQQVRWHFCVHIVKLQYSAEQICALIVYWKICYHRWIVLFYNCDKTELYNNY